MIMKHFSFVCIAVFISFFSSAQNLSWARGMGGAGDDGSYYLAADAAGNVFHTGYFQDTLDADPGPGTFTLASNGSYDAYISKLDAAGNFLWAASLGSTQLDVGWGIGVDASGNVLLAGSYNGTVDFDPGPATYTMGGNAQNGFLLKLDAAGNFMWARNFAGAGDDEIYSLTQDASGSIYLAGYFGNTLDFDPGPGTYTLSSLAYDAFVCKLDAAGNFVWAKKMGGNSLDIALSVVVDPTGNVYTSGIFRGIADFDPGPGVFNLTAGSPASAPINASGNAFVCKLDATGNFVWAIGHIGTGTSQLNTIVIAPGGDLVATGWHRGTNDFDPGPGTAVSSSQGYDGVIAKISAAGAAIWTSFIRGPGDDFVDRAAVNANGFIYCNGGFTSTADFDPSPATYNVTSNGGQDLFMLQLDGMGSFVNVYTTGSAGADFASGIAYTASGIIYLSGAFTNTTAFSSTLSLTATGQGDAFVLKFNDCSALITAQPVSASVLPGVTVQFSVVSPGVTFQWQQNIGFGFVNVNNGGQFSGATTPVLTVSGVGPLQNSNIFRCLVADNTCSLTSVPALLTVLDDTGLGDLPAQTLLAAYPNPATDKVQLQLFSTVTDPYYRITDQTGRLLRAGSIKERNTTVDLSGLPAGLYFIQAGSTHQKPVKIVKQ